MKKATHFLRFQSVICRRLRGSNSIPNCQPGIAGVKGAAEVKENLFNRPHV